MSDLAFRSRYQAALAAAPTPGASDGKDGGQPAREQGEDSAGDYL